MSILNIIKARRSIRKYRPDSIPDAAFARVMEAARSAPSGKNLQPWKFIIVEDPDLKHKLAEASHRQFFMAQAPKIIVACGYPEQSYQHQGNYMQSWSIDVTCAMDHLMLQAQEEGLGSCWIGAFEEKDVKQLLNIPENVRVLALTPLGFPAESSRDRGRNPLEEIISYDKYK